MVATLLESSKGIVFIICKFTIKRLNQNKADNTVNKNSDFLNLLVQSLIYGTLYVSMLSRTLGFRQCKFCHTTVSCVTI